MRLSVHYFGAADLMRKHFDKIEKVRKSRGRLSRAMDFDWNQYLSIWLGLLYVTAEGFLQLDIAHTMRSRAGEFKTLAFDAQKIEKLIPIGQNNLRLFRNGMFHYQSDPAKLRQFFAGSLIEWAKKLHFHLKRFFSRYRVARLMTWAAEEKEIEDR